jgi:hypothetical protein
MWRRDVLGRAGAALPWPYPTRMSQALLDDTVGFTGQILFLSAKTPALVLGVVRPGQTSIQGFGRRAADTSEPPAADTLFRIGSITKGDHGPASREPRRRRRGQPRRSADQDRSRVHLARGIGVCTAINAFDVAAGLAMAKAANDLIAELAPR